MDFVGFIYLQNKVWKEIKPVVCTTFCVGKIFKTSAILCQRTGAAYKKYTGLEISL